MNEKLTKWAAAAVLSIGAAAPALGGSVTRPGDTIGLAVGVPLPEGFHLGNTTTEECRTQPRKKRASSSMSPSWFGPPHGRFLAHDCKVILALWFR